MVDSLIAGRYLLQAEIASRSRQTTFRALDRETGETVAVKIIAEHLVSDSRFIAYFHRQAHGVAELAHPNVTRLFDYGHYGSAYFLVEEWVEGDTLAAYLAQRRALPVADALAIAVGMAGALSAAHRVGLVHGGLIPDDVTIRADGLVKVSDFGIPKLEGVPVTRETAEHRAVALYVSPEQAQGGAPTAASDVYSLGVILYQMIAGRPPFEGATSLTVALKHVNEDPPRLRSLDPSVPQAVATVVERAMAKMPASRYRDGAELEQAIQGLPHYRPGLLPSVGARLAPSFFQRLTTPPVSCLAGVFVFLLIVSLGGLLFALAGSAARQAPTPTVTAVAIVVPSLIGHPVADAERFAQEKKVGLEITERADSQAARGVVVEQSPSASQFLKPGDPLRVVVSQGPPETEVPNLLGSDLSQAQNALRRARLRVGTTSDRASGEENRGQILGQNPPPGTKVADGSPVDLIIGGGPPPTATSAPTQVVTPTAPVVAPPTETPLIMPTPSLTPTVTLVPPTPTLPPITPTATATPAPPSATPTRATTTVTPSATPADGGATPAITATPQAGGTSTEAVTRTPTP